MLPRVQQVMRQTRERINHGNTHSPGKIVSLFEPHTEIIRKGKAGKPTEFGKMVKIQEAEQQIVTHYEVYDRRPATPTCGPGGRAAHAAVRPSAQAGHRRRGLLLRRQRSGGARAGRQTHLDAQPQQQEPAAQAAREQALVPQGPAAGAPAAKAASACSSARHGLNRCRYKGEDGMRRWVGLGVIADNLINIGLTLNAAAAE